MLTISMKHNFHNLEIWKLGKKLADSIYDAENLIEQISKIRRMPLSFQKTLK